PTAPSPLYRIYSQYRTLAYSPRGRPSLLRCSGSIPCSIRCGTIRSSKSSLPRSRPRRRTVTRRGERQPVPEAKAEAIFAMWVAWGLVRLRGERLADIGLKRPASWMRTFMIGIGFAAIVFIAMYLSEKAGFRRDLSKFKDVQGNLELTLFGVFYAFIGAGFYEE